MSDAVANTLQNANDLPEEAVAVTHRDIAGARFVSSGDASWIVESYRVAT